MFPPSNSLHCSCTHHEATTTADDRNVTGLRHKMFTDEELFKSYLCEVCRLTSPGRCDSVLMKYTVNLWISPVLTLLETFGIV